MKEVTIYDIARELNVSPATISRGLKDHPSISEKMKKRIRIKAEEMGYRTNTFASNLRTKRTYTLGVIVPRLDSNFMSTALAGMERAAHESGYNLIITQSFESCEKEKANARTLFNSRVDGLIVSLAADTTDFSHFNPFVEKNIPLLFFDRVSECIGCVNIVIDNFQMGYDVTSHLIQQGCKKIMHITGNQNRNVYADRLNGYKKALSENALNFLPERVIETSLSIQSGEEAARKILNMPNRPDAVFIANDACAAGCMNVLKAEGIRIPDEIAVAGFNNDPISQLLEPRLTTVHYPGNEIGEMVSKLMINHLNGSAPLNLTNKIVLRSELIIRESTLRNRDISLR
ncbi:MAG TPA: LacI family DNA-binding transcriptional regulator [Prolixibacteraceae bacterium]|nr:LacI family DNA-binding transcriptional regulator [Prolixibacteraceae bacterium]